MSLYPAWISASIIHVLRSAELNSSPAPTDSDVVRQAIAAGPIAPKVEGRIKRVDVPQRTLWRPSSISLRPQRGTKQTKGTKSFCDDWNLFASFIDSDVDH